MEMTWVVARRNLTYLRVIGIITVIYLSISPLYQSDIISNLFHKSHKGNNVDTKEENLYDYHHIKNRIQSNTEIFKEQNRQTRLSILTQQNKTEKGIPPIPNDLKMILGKILQRDFHDDRQDSCEKGFYLLKGMSSCEPWLSCEQINDGKILKKMKKIGGGVGKLVYSGQLHDQFSVAIAYSRRPGNPRLGERVKVGNENLMKFQPSPYVLQVVGYCLQGSNSTLITESCSQCTDLRRIRKRSKLGFSKFDDKLRLEWLIKIVGGFDLLHHTMGLPMVHCDLHTPDEFLTQYILMEDNQIVMSDLDELPQVDANNNVFASCKEETDGVMKSPEFIAPEQRYSEHDYELEVSRKPITEKADIWKIPDIASLIMGGSPSEQALTRKMDDIHSQCKSENPKLRPTARAILIEYLQFYKSFLL